MWSLLFSFFSFSVTDLFTLMFECNIHQIVTSSLADCQRPHPSRHCPKSCWTHLSKRAKIIFSKYIIRLSHFRKIRNKMLITNNIFLTHNFRAYTVFGHWRIPKKLINKKKRKQSFRSWKRANVYVLLETVT